MDRKRIEEIMSADADYPSEQYVHMMGDYGGITGGELRELCRLALLAQTNSEPLVEKRRQTMNIPRYEIEKLERKLRELREDAGCWYVAVCQEEDNRLSGIRDKALDDADRLRALLDKYEDEK